jgi:hypothetical protein
MSALAAVSQTPSLLQSCTQRLQVPTFITKKILNWDQIRVEFYPTGSGLPDNKLQTHLMSPPMLRFTSRPLTNCIEHSFIPSLLVLPYIKVASLISKAKNLKSAITEGLLRPYVEGAWIWREEDNWCDGLAERLAITFHLPIFFLLYRVNETSMLKPEPNSGQ